MATTLKTKNSVTTTVVPTTLAQGELAVNITDKKMWVGNAATTPVQILGAGATNRAGGSNTQVQYNSSGDLAGSANFVFDGTNVGIGISSPAYRLEVSGSAVRITNGSNGSAANNGLIFDNTAGASPNNYLPAINWNTGTLTWATIDGLRAAGGGFGGDLRFNTMNTSGTNTERMRIDSAGNVGINTTGPSDKLTVTGGLRSNGATGNANVTGALLDWNANTRLFAYDSAGAGILFYTTPSGGSVTERMRIDGDGNVSLGGASATARLRLSQPSGDGTVSVSGDGTNYGVFRSVGSGEYQLGSLSSVPVKFITNNTVRMTLSNTSGSVALQSASTSADGTGITFPATQSASSNANTLDDYEEGTWTPVLDRNSSSPSVTYVAQAGKYTKVGNVITLSFGINWSANSGGAGTYFVGGIPFAVPSGNANYTSGFIPDISGVTFPSGRTAIGLQAGGGSSKLQILAAGSNVLTTGVDTIGGTGFIFASITYFAS